MNSDWLINVDFVNLCIFIYAWSIGMYTHGVVLVFQIRMKRAHAVFDSVVYNIHDVFLG